VDLAARILHYATRLLFPLGFVPILFPYVPTVFMVLATLAAVVYMGQRRSAGLPLTQSRAFHVMRLSGIAGLLNVFMYFGLLLHSQMCVLGPLSNQLEPVREYYRGQAQTQPGSKP